MSRKFISLLQLLTPWKSLKDCAQLRTMGRIALLFMIVLMVLSVTRTVAQGVNPCNQNRNPDPTKEPRDYDAICLPELGRDPGNLDCIQSAYEEYGGKVLKVIQDVNGDGVPDWIASRFLCDTLVPPLDGHLPQELLLQFGNTTVIPTIDNAIRIGPREIESTTRFVASGDFDGDGNIDICTKIEFANDTSFGNTDFFIGNVVVFWGSPGGKYSIDDTTRLECDADIFIVVFNGSPLRVGKRDALVFNTGGGFSRNVGVVRFAKLYMYLLEPGQRWGRNGVTRKPSLRWWNAPNSEYVQPETSSNPEYRNLDHDGDGIEDVVMTTNSGGSTIGPVWTGVLYGRQNELPDTSEAEIVVFDSSGGLNSIYADITGDGIPELMVMQNQIGAAWIYLGLRGQRLKEQYGTGKDSGATGRSWGRPWTIIKLAGTIGGFNWYRRSQLFQFWDLGDGDGDGIDDIWVDCFPDVLLYGTGDHLDDYIDAMAYLSSGVYMRSGQHIRDKNTGKTIQMIGTVNYLYFFNSTPEAYHKRSEYGYRIVPPEVRRKETSVGPGVIDENISKEISARFDGSTNSIIVHNIGKFRTGTPAKFEMIDVLGTVRINGAMDSEIMNIPCQGVPSGAYWLRISLANGYRYLPVLVAR